MPGALTIHVRLHDGRYHGDGDWPPCPARVFQALVAGAGLSGQIDMLTEPLEWLEKLPPPLVGAPLSRRGQRVLFYMPNNDLDSVSGDPRRVAKIRTAKKFLHPRLFDAEIPFLYIWQDVPDEDLDYAVPICSLADRIYQLGRGVDMAWAWAELLDAPQVEALLALYPGRIRRPAPGVSSSHGNTLLCPHEGSLESVRERYETYRRRFAVEPKGKTVKLTFQRAPQSSFRNVAYDSPPSRSLYELRSLAQSSFESWPLSKATELVVCLRDGAVGRLKGALPERHGEIERTLVGRTADGANAGPTAERVRIVPLPSIGHRHADRAIRRVLVEVPGTCPLRADDVNWAFSGLEALNMETGEVYPIILTPAADASMLRHYGIGDGAEAHTWRTIVPAALPAGAGRRRINPTRKTAEAKGAVERLREQQRAAAAVSQALRHAGVHTPLGAIRVQREPFEGNGERVEAFAPGTRFPKERLWHIEITFEQPFIGPLIIGDGRFLGLGIMAPVYRPASKIDQLA